MRKIVALKKRLGGEWMVKIKTKKEPSLGQLAKCPTGIKGLDEITGGGP